MIVYGSSIDTFLPYFNSSSSFKNCFLGSVKSDKKTVFSCHY